MKQRVGIARAFALSPKLLLLDEPFGMLDSLTRWELQDVLMEVWKRSQVTAICVTHDVDEAILLADRVVMMTNGPNARIGKIMEIDLPRPRSRKALLEHPDYYRYRDELLDFLEEYEGGAATRDGRSRSRRRPARPPEEGSMGMSSKQRLVIIGNGMAPGRVLDRLFEKAPGAFAVTIFNAETAVNYDRIMLSPVLSGEKAYEDIIIHGDDWYAQHGVTLHKGKAVVRDRPRGEERARRGRDGRRLRQADHRHRVEADRHRGARPHASRRPHLSRPRRRQRHALGGAAGGAGGGDRRRAAWASRRRRGCGRAAWR